MCVLGVVSSRAETPGMEDGGCGVGGGWQETVKFSESNSTLPLSSAQVCFIHHI